MDGRDPLLVRLLPHRRSEHCPRMPGMAVLLGVLSWLDHAGGVFLVAPFVATLTIPIYLPQVSIAQPLAVVGGSVAGAALRSGLSVLLGFGPGVALLPALAAMIAPPLLRIFHPPGIALVMYPALLRPGPLFAVDVVLPFTLVAVISATALSRWLTGFPRYPRSQQADSR